jgi:hypothetical protein
MTNKKKAPMISPTLPTSKNANDTLVSEATSRRLTAYLIIHVRADKGADGKARRVNEVMKEIGETLSR